MSGSRPGRAGPAAAGCTVAVSGNWGDETRWEGVVAEFADRLPAGFTGAGAFLALSAAHALRYPR